MLMLALLAFLHGVLSMFGGIKWLQLACLCLWKYQRKMH